MKMCSKNRPRIYAKRACMNKINLIKKKINTRKSPSSQANAHVLITKFVISPGLYGRFFQKCEKFPPCIWMGASAGTNVEIRYNHWAY